MRMISFVVVVCMIPTFCYPQTDVSSRVVAVPTGDVLLRDPADTHRLVKATTLLFQAPHEYQFVIRFSAGNDHNKPPVRVVVYKETQHKQEEDCTKVLCWEEWLYASSQTDPDGVTQKRSLKVGARFVVIAWQGGDKSRGGEPISADCKGTICGETLAAASNGSSLRLSLKSSLQSAILEIAPVK